MNPMGSFGVLDLSIYFCKCCGQLGMPTAVPSKSSLGKVNVCMSVPLIHVPVLTEVNNEPVYSSF